MSERTFRVGAAITTMWGVASSMDRPWRWALALRSGPEERKARREGFVFYVILEVVLASAAVHALATSATLGAPGRQAAFGLLMLLHGYLHWRSPLVAVQPRLALPFLAVQGPLALALVAIARSPGLALGLFPMLVGVSAGTVRDRRIGVGSAVAYLVLGVAALSVLMGRRDLAQDATMMILTALFAVFFASAYRRQVDARDEVQSLLGKLTEAHDRLAEYALRVEGLTLAAERQRMARELHDTLVQGLAGLILQIEAASGHLAEERTQRAAAILQHALARARETLREAREAIGGLREAGVASGDIVAAIRCEAERFTKQSGIACRMDLAPVTPVDAEACEQARRIVAEALGNAARHASARSVAVSLHLEGEQVVVAVEDDGVGFDVEREVRRPGHYGILGMRERSSLVHGALHVASAPGRGTRAELRLPRCRPDDASETGGL